MGSYNKVILMGNLTRDPELRYTPTGTAIARLGLAVNRSWRTDTGELREEVTFIDIDAFSRQAETIAKYLKKGNPIFIEGRLKLHTWDDKQTGQKQSKLRVTLETFSFVDSPKTREGSSENANPSPKPAPAAPPPGSGPDSYDEPPPEDDDVPF